MRNILIVGGDRRQLALAGLLREKGYRVSLLGFDKLGAYYEPMESPETIFLPVPYRDPGGSLKAPYAEEKLELKDIVRRYPACVYYLGGCDAAAREVFGGRIRYVDLMADEAYQVENALLTTQAAVCVFQQASEVALCDLHCVVVGYGRIAKFLCRLLVAHGARVTATARKESDLVLIRLERMGAVHTSRLACALPEADVIFTTVPHNVFGEEELKSIRSGVMLMELASPPYGMDMALAKELGVNVRLEQGLPGRYFPVSAARAILHAFESEEI